MSIIVRLTAFKAVDDLDRIFLAESFRKRLIDGRSRFAIAVIDDETFTPIENLRRHKYNITHYRDVPSIETLATFPIVLCDLVGVGAALSPTLQGAHIIKELKKSYPEKIVVAYTGGGHRELLAASLPLSDYFLRKDADVEEWCDVLDKAISSLANPAAVWRKVRHRLLDVGITPYQLAELEDLFVTRAMRGESFTVELISNDAAKLKLPGPVKAILTHVLVHMGFELAKEFIKSGG